MTDELVEIAAITLWRTEAERAAPNVAKQRTPDAWLEVHPVEQERWRQLARAVLAAVTPAIEARVTGEIVAWLRERSGTYHGRMYGECEPNKRRHLSERSCSLSDIANAIESGDYKESQP